MRASACSGQCGGQHAGLLRITYRDGSSPAALRTNYLCGCSAVQVKKPPAWGGSWPDRWATRRVRGAALTAAARRALAGLVLAPAGDWHHPRRLLLPAPPLDLHDMMRDGSAFPTQPGLAQHFWRRRRWRWQGLCLGLWAGPIRPLAIATEYCCHQHRRWTFMT